MTITRYAKQVIPFIILFSLLSLLGHQLFTANAGELPSPLVGKPLPAFHLPNLYQPGKTMSQRSLRGHVSLLNIWSSWCSACAAEHAMLMRIKDQYHVPIYGIAYRDNPEDAMRVLARKGNPYTAVGIDQRGVVGIDLGVYGTPETFVVSPEGKILYRQVGYIDEDTWNNQLYPFIRKYMAAQ